MDKIEEVKELINKCNKLGFITEREMYLIKGRINKYQNIELISLVADSELYINEEWFQKAYTWLNNNLDDSGLGYREQEIIKNCDTIRLKDFYNISLHGEDPLYLPLSEVFGSVYDDYDKKHYNKSFQYYYINNINVVG